MLAESLMAIPGGQSKLRVTMKLLRLTGRVVRRLVWETATDETLGLSAQMAYQFLFTLAPGLLFLWHLLGLFGTDPATLHKMLGVVRAFLPPDPKVQEILDSVVANVIVTGSGGALATAVDAVLAEFPQQLAQFRAGNDKVLQFFVGQCMKRLRGQANPQQLNSLLAERLK